MERSSISALASLLQDQTPVIERVRQDTKSIRDSRSPQLSLTADADRQASLKNYSIFSSSIGDEIFSFDDEIITSLAYRNAIKRLASKVKAAQQDSKPDEHRILDEPLIDLEEPSRSHNRPKTKFNAFSEHACLIPTMTITHTDTLSNQDAEDLKLLPPTSTRSPSQYFKSFSRGRTGKYYTDREVENASDSEREPATYPPFQARQSTLASDIYASPRQSTIISSQSYAQEDVPEVSFDEGSRISNPDMASRSPKEHQSTLPPSHEAIQDNAVALFDYNAVALFDYARKNVDELSLKEGQVLDVWSHQIQGWLWAENPRTGESGFVPEKSVRELPDRQAIFNALSRELQANKERQSGVNEPSRINASWINVSANQKDTNGDWGEVTRQRVTDDSYREVLYPHKMSGKRIQATPEPSRRPSQSIEITADPVDNWDKDDGPLMTMRREHCSSEITRSSVLSAKTEKSSSPQKKSQSGVKSTVRQITPRSPRVRSPSSPSIHDIAIGVLGINDSIGSRVDIEPVQGEAQRSPAANRLGRRVEREHDRTGKTKASEAKRVPNVPDIVEYRDINSGIDGKDKASTEKVTYRPEMASRKKERIYRQREPAVDTPAAAVMEFFKKRSEKRFSPSVQKHRNRPVRDNNQDSGSGVPL